MKMIQNVPGPSKDAFTTLNNQVATADISTSAQLLTALNGMSVGQTKMLSVYGDVGTATIGWNGRSSGLLTKTAATRWEILVYSVSQNIIAIGEVNTSTGAISNLTKYYPQLIQSKTYTYQVTVSGNSTVAISASNLGISTPANYTPIAITEYNTSSDNVLVRGIRCNETSGNVCWLKNVSASDAACNLRVTILYMFTH